MFRCDKRCEGKFGNFVGTKHTLRGKALKKSAFSIRVPCSWGGGPGCFFGGRGPRKNFKWYAASPTARCFFIKKIQALRASLP